MSVGATTAAARAVADLTHSLEVEPGASIIILPAPRIVAVFRISVWPQATLVGTSQLISLHGRHLAVRQLQHRSSHGAY